MSAAPAPAPMPVPMPTPVPEAALDAALTLSERVAEQLRGQITRGVYAPGQRLSEQALSDSLGISRNTLREVFRVLARDGLVKHARTGACSSRCRASRRSSTSTASGA